MAGQAGLQVVTAPACTTGQTLVCEIQKGTEPWTEIRRQNDTGDGMLDGVAGFTPVPNSSTSWYLQHNVTNPASCTAPAAGSVRIRNLQTSVTGSLSNNCCGTDKGAATLFSTTPPNSTYDSANTVLTTAVPYNQPFVHDGKTTNAYTPATFLFDTQGNNNGIYRSSGSGGNIHNVVVYNAATAQFLAVYSNRWGKSSNGDSWTWTDLPITNTAYKFIAALSSSNMLIATTGGKVIKSVDGGTTWSDAYQSPTNVTAALISWNGYYIMHAGYSASSIAGGLMYSSDGVSWSRFCLSNPTHEPIMPFATHNPIVANGHLFFFGGFTTRIDTDGSIKYSNPRIPSNYVPIIAYYDDGRMISTAFSSSHSPSGVSSGPSSYATYNPANQYWLHQDNMTAAHPYYQNVIIDVKLSGNRAVGLDYSGYPCTSDDGGLTWTTRSTYGSGGYDIHYAGGNRWIWATSLGHLQSTDNGTTWSTMLHVGTPMFEQTKHTIFGTYPNLISIHRETGIIRTGVWSGNTITWTVGPTITGITAGSGYPMLISGYTNSGTHAVCVETHSDYGNSYIVDTTSGAIVKTQTRNQGLAGMVQPIGSSDVMAGGYYSRDSGSTWIVHNTDLSSIALFSVGYNSSGFHQAVGSLLYTTPNLDSGWVWSPHSSNDVVPNISGVVYVNGTFYGGLTGSAIGIGNPTIPHTPTVSPGMYTSVDGLKWTVTPGSGTTVYNPKGMVQIGTTIVTLVESSTSGPYYSDSPYTSWTTSTTTGKPPGSAIWTGASNGTVAVVSPTIDGITYIEFMKSTSPSAFGAISSAAVWIFTRQQSTWSDKYTVDGTTRYIVTTPLPIAVATPLTYETGVECPSVAPSAATPGGVPGDPGPPGADSCGLRWESVWASGTEYHHEAGSPCMTDLVSNANVAYIAKTTHTASADNEPGVGASWSSVWDIFGAASDGLKWAGSFMSGTLYKKNDVIMSVKDGNAYVCMQEHTSTSGGTTDFTGDPGYKQSSMYWEAMTDATALEEEKDIINSLIDGVMDWWADAPTWERVLGVAAGIGLVAAGAKVVDMMTDDGDDPEGTGESADTRYNGSPGYNGGFTPPTLQAVVASIMRFAGYDNSQFDVSMLPAKQVHFSLTSGINSRTLLNNLALTYQFDVVPSGGKVKFVPKYQASIRTLTYDDLGHATMDLGGTAGPAPYTAKRIQGIDLPRSVQFSYYSSALDHNIFTQTSSLYTFEDGQDVQISVPFTLDDDEAMRIAETTLVNSHIEQQEFVFTTDYNNIDLEPGDVISIPAGGISTDVRIKEINETEDGVLEIKTSRADYNTSSYAPSGTLVVSPPLQSSNIPTTIGYSQSLFFEVPALDSEDKTPRIYAAVHGYNKAGWPGAAIYKSVDGGNTYNLAAQTSTPVTIGMVSATIPAPSKGYHGWDDTTEISVTLKQGKLDTLSDIAVLNGENWAMIGNELIGFVNATLTAPNTYKLTRLLRGRRGTEIKCGSHINNELFVLLDENLTILPYATDETSKIVKFKTVTIGSSLDKVSAVDIQPMALNMVPWAPSHAKMTKTGNDYVITWVERPRLNNGLQDDRELTHDSDWAGYGITIFGDSNKNTVKRSAVPVATTYTYTEAMQIADFGSVQANLYASVVQMSTTMGGGWPAVVSA